MRWFHNLQISRKFIVSFSLVLLLLAAIGRLGLYNASRINGNLDEIYNDRLAAVAELGAISTHVQKINTGLGNYLLSPNMGDRNKIKEKIRLNSLKIEQSVQRLSVIRLAEVEQQELKLFTSLWNGYWTDAEKIIGFVDLRTF